MIGRLHHVIIDCPDPAALGGFYAELLGLPVTYATDDFVVVSIDDRHSGLGFQRVEDYQPPRWPDPRYPQQLHLDVMVDDPEKAGTAVLALGCRKLAGTNVFADPAGHPFCLIPRPEWATPVHSPDPG